MEIIERKSPSCRRHGCKTQSVRKDGNQQPKKVSIGHTKALSFGRSCTRICWVRLHSKTCYNYVKQQRQSYRIYVLSCKRYNTSSSHEWMPMNEWILTFEFHVKSSVHPITGIYYTKVTDPISNQSERTRLPQSWHFLPSPELRAPPFIVVILFGSLRTRWNTIITVRNNKPPLRSRNVIMLPSKTIEEEERLSFRSVSNENGTAAAAAVATTKTTANPRIIALPEPNFAAVFPFDHHPSIPKPPLSHQETKKKISRRPCSSS